MGNSRIVAIAILQLIILLFGFGSADPLQNGLVFGCSNVKSINTTNFEQNFELVMRSLLEGAATSGFATAEQSIGTDPVYGLAQCRQDKNSSECLKCIRAAEKKIRTCSNVSGGRIMYDDCFLRYESDNFFTQNTSPGSAELCVDYEIIDTGKDPHIIQGLMSDLCKVAPRVHDYYAAYFRKGSNKTIYGLAYCMKSLSSEGCRDCLNLAEINIRNCLNHSNGRAIEAGCYLRYDFYPFFTIKSITDLRRYIRTEESGSAIAWILIWIFGGTFLVGVIITPYILGPLIVGFFKRCRNGKVHSEGPTDFDFSILQQATNNFHPANKLGEGAFGQVYKGTLKSGKVVAVKKLSLTHSQLTQALKQFAVEVKLIANVHHRNLLRLLGCSTQGPERLLVYEYMQNRSLDKKLFGKRENPLSWQTRYNIMLGTARGIAYLHEEFDVCIIHRDIKSSNILLDDDLQPKVADFGLARLLPDDRTHLTTRCAGTLGYTAPEYAIHGQLTEKADTYSYGVVVLELITGRKSIDLSKPPHKQYLLDWIWKLYEANRILEAVDECIAKEEYSEEEVLRALNLALLCTQASVADRPSMSEVVAMLVRRRELTNLDVPLRPAFIDLGFKLHSDSSLHDNTFTAKSVDAR
ncbi:cysteine-rich receptor-like protein kinase 2 [Cryptomeria japonica]|uniref:cysteine-rich receptor-like protein kinase 2 n=1 Tax=Cryptomeria japonica TaxID=3369 RepID=UPI0027DA6240|nr:cysteine-rich receptor-like protein kinase 2 [Cryptomeria japonica]